MQNSGRILPPMSLQQFVDCAGASEPSGFFLGWATHYALKNGIEMETSYPTVLKPGTCHYNKRCVAVKFNSIGGITAGHRGNETALETALKMSPVQSAIKVGDQFQKYTHGTACPPTASSSVGRVVATHDCKAC